MKTMMCFAFSFMWIIWRCDMDVTAVSNSGEPSTPDTVKNSSLVMSLSDTMVQLGKEVTVSYKVGDVSDLSVKKCNSTVKGQVEKLENEVWTDFLPEFCENIETEKFAKNNTYSESFIISQDGTFRIALVYSLESDNTQSVGYSDEFIVK